MRHKHWTEESTAAFAYRIASDFVEQLERKRESLNWSKRRLARELELSPGRISQVINDPGNLTLELMVKVARALQMKVSILAYEDGDKENYRGPINADVFRSCWEITGKPKGKLELDQVHLAATIDNMFEQYVRVGDKLSPVDNAPIVTLEESKRENHLMAEPTQIIFKYQELAEVLARHANVTTGHWGIFIKFALGATNIGPDNNNLQPAAIVPVVEIGIRQFDEPCNLTVDAAQIKPVKAVKAAPRKRKQVK
jgi:transcriptional regulator with XRE-family HTH domain